jgi:transposase
MVYIGIDLHRKRSQVAALDESGELLFNRRVATRADELFSAFGDVGEKPVEVVFEATFGWGWLADLLAEAGIPTHMAHPLATKAISSARVKNDAVDAKTLAHLLRTELLPEAWLAPPSAREARRLVRIARRLGPDQGSAEEPDPRRARRARGEANRISITTDYQHHAVAF